MLVDSHSNRDLFKELFISYSYIYNQSIKHILYHFFEFIVNLSVFKMVLFFVVKGQTMLIHEHWNRDFP